jgi:CheY-like chemotaxis protein
MLANIYADELAEECRNQIDKLINVKHEKIEAYINYFLSIMAMLSIDIQMALRIDNNEQSAIQTVESVESVQETKTVLAVDDNTFFLDSLKDALRDSEYRLSCVTSGAAALKFLQNHHPHLYILDIEMPEMDGYELAQKIKECGKTAPIIYLTGNATREYVEKSIKAGAVDFITKPINNDYVLQKIKRHIQIRQP